MSQNNCVFYFFINTPNPFDLFLPHISLLLVPKAVNKSLFTVRFTMMTWDPFPNEPVHSVHISHTITETQPPLWNFMRAPGSSGLVVGYVPHLSLTLDDRIVTWCPLKKKNKNLWFSCTINVVCSICLKSSPESESFPPGWSDWAQAGVLAATWRRGVVWHCLGDTPCDPSSGPGSQSYSGSQNAMRRRAGMDHLLNWDQD